jgi:hypothetical protein
MHGYILTLHNIIDKMKKYYFVFIVSIFIAFGCSNRQEPEREARINIFIDLDKTEKIDPSLFIDSIKYIQLETNNDVLVADILKVLTDDKHLYILDRLSIVHVFDKAGKFKFNIDKQGHGPGEYLKIDNMLMRDSTLKVLDLSQRRIFHFNKSDGQFMKCMPFEKLVYALFPINDGRYLGSLPANLCSEGFGVFLFNSDYSVFRTLLRYTGDYPLFSQDFGIFSIIEDNLFGIYSQVENAIYHFRYPDLEKIYSFAIRGRNSIANHRGVDMLNLSHQQISNLPLLWSYKETSAWIVLRFIHDSAPIVLIDKNDNSVLVANEFTNTLFSMFQPVLSDMKNMIAGQIFPFDLLKMYEIHLEGQMPFNEQLSEFVKNMNENDNPIIQLIYLK